MAEYYHIEIGQFKGNNGRIDLQPWPQLLVGLGNVLFLLSSPFPFAVVGFRLRILCPALNTQYAFHRQTKTTNNFHNLEKGERGGLQESLFFNFVMLNCEFNIISLIMSCKMM